MGRFSFFMCAILIAILLVKEGSIPNKVAALALNVALGVLPYGILAMCVRGRFLLIWQPSGLV